MLGTIFGNILKIFNTEDNSERDLIKVQFLFFKDRQVVCPYNAHTT